VQQAQDYYPECPEAFLVSLARSGDRKAFEELVLRRQSSMRNLMRRVCGNYALADDLAQQVFLKVWLNLRKLRQPSAFGAWLKRLAVSVWLQFIRKNDALRGASELAGTERPQRDATAVGMDLDRALATLPDAERLCVVLSCQEGLTHSEIAAVTGMPLGTVKSHIRIGAGRLQQILSAYREAVEAKQP
jgi:RNA polymerase sigma-70 factor (ECF subfamily)